MDSTMEEGRREDLIENYCKSISQEAKDLYLRDEIDTIDMNTTPLTPLEFHKKYVSKNLPVLVKNGAKDWPAISKWSIDYFREKMPTKKITVAATPNGYADAIAKNQKDQKEYFVMPEEREMTMSNFLDDLTNPQDSEVLYIQQQNSNFESEYFELWKDAVEFPWASEAFGKQADAVNFWMGDERAITSMHKDPYENIYCVVSGRKEFILHPPTDLPWIPYGKYESAVYKREGSWRIEPVAKDRAEDSSEGLVPWVAIDPLAPDYEKYPKYKNVSTIKVVVEAGDVLYLPSLWFHHVQQSHASIAVNFWYDMEYDIKYVYFKGLELLSQ